MAHTLIYRHLRPFAHAEPFPLKKKKKKSFQVSHYPSHFICDHRLVQGWNGTRNTKETEQRLGFGGFQGAKFKFVIPHVQVNIKMLQLNSYNSLVNKTDSGQVKSPCSLLNEKGLVNWQDSLLNRWRNVQSPLSVFFCPALYLTLSSCEGRATVRVCVITSRAKIRSPSFFSFLLWQKVQHPLLLWSAMPHSSVPMTSAWVGYLFFLPFPPCVSHSLSVSRSESDHCTGLNFPLRWAYSMTAV